jgi:hypothetical protein
MAQRDQLINKLEDVADQVSSELAAQLSACVMQFLFQFKDHA